MRLVAGDVGGTKSLLRAIDEDGLIRAEQRYEAAEWPSFDAILNDFLPTAGASANAACFAVAGPVLDGQAVVTNTGWRLGARAIEATHGVACVSLINDFQAVAFGVPQLGPNDLLPLQQGTRDRTAPMAILGAGTGLGEAFVHSHRGEWHVVPTEGGHADFAPQNELQARLLLHLLHRYGGHVSWERVCSGMGLVNIFTFLGGPEIEPADIAERAEGGDPIAVKTLEVFVDIYGAEAGNMALKTLARGGVFLAGGIGAKNVHWLTDGRFIAAFRRKGRFENFMASVPVDLITNERVGLIGAMEVARRLVESR